MRYILFLLLSTAAVFSSCRLSFKRVTGNGNTTSDIRNIANARRIKLAGSYALELVKGTPASVKIEADDNLIPYIMTNVEHGWLIVRSRDNVSFSTVHPIKITVTTDQFEEIQLAGSGNISTRDKFTADQKMVIKVLGSGDVNMQVNVPEIKADIAGSGSITLSGETRDENIQISGVGSYKAGELKAENAKVHIAGSGSVTVFADVSLDIRMIGIGSVYYKGAAVVTQHITGSGQVKKME